MKALYLSVQWQEQVKKTASLQRGWLLWKAAYIILTWGCYAAFDDIGTSSSDDEYSRARKPGFLLHFF